MNAGLSAGFHRAIKLAQRPASLIGSEPNDGQMSQHSQGEIMIPHTLGIIPQILQC